MINVIRNPLIEYLRGIAPRPEKYIRRKAELKLIRENNEEILRISFSYFT